jgi:hypothetical protein
MTTLGTGINGRDLEHRPGVMSTTSAGRAVEIAGRIEDQAGAGLKPVCAVVVEAIQHLLRPAPARLGRQLERRPAAGGPEPQLLPVPP